MGYTVYGNKDGETEMAANFLANAPEAPPAADSVNRETYLKSAEAIMSAWIELEGHSYPANTRISCGFPKNSRKAIGQCWSHENSGDKTFEIFVSPSIDDNVQVLYVLLHEMVHATLGIAEGHGKLFGAICRKLGFEGKSTANYAGADLAELIQTAVIGKIGAYPHAKLNTGEGSEGPKKAKTYLIKCECEECGYIAYTTAKWLDQVGAPCCADHGAMSYYRQPGRGNQAPPHRTGVRVMSDYIERTNGGTSFTGSDVNIFRALSIASGLDLYAKTGMKPNRAWTPTAMMRAAKEMTGRSFKARDYKEAANSLRALAENAKRQPRE